MIESGHHLDCGTIIGVDHGDDACVHAAEVVQPSRGEELLMRPEDRRGRGVVHPKVVSIDIGSRAASGLRHMIKNMNAGMTDTPHRRSVHLFVEP